MFRCPHNVLPYHFTVQHHTNYKSRVFQNILCLLHSPSYSNQGCLTHQRSKKGCFHVSIISRSAQHQIHFPHQPTFKKKLQPPLREAWLRSTAPIISWWEHTSAPVCSPRSHPEQRQHEQACLRTKSFLQQAGLTCIDGLHEALVGSLDKPPGTLIHLSDIEGLVEIPVVAIAIDGDIHCQHSTHGKLAPAPHLLPPGWNNKPVQMGHSNCEVLLHKNSLRKLFQQKQIFHAYPAESI